MCVNYVLIEISSGTSLSLSMLLYERFAKEKLFISSSMAHTGTISREIKYKIMKSEKFAIVGPRVGKSLDENYHDRSLN